MNSASQTTRVDGWNRFPFLSVRRTLLKGHIGPEVLGEGSLDPHTRRRRRFWVLGEGGSLGSWVLRSEEQGRRENQVLEFGGETVLRPQVWETVRTPDPDAEWWRVQDRDHSLYWWSLPK